MHLVGGSIRVIRLGGLYCALTLLHVVYRKSGSIPICAHNYGGHLAVAHLMVWLSVGARCCQPPAQCQFIPLYYFSGVHTYIPLFITNNYGDHRRQYLKVRLFWDDIESTLMGSGLESDKVYRVYSFSCLCSNSVLWYYYFCVANNSLCRR